MNLRDYLAACLERDGYDGLAGQGCGCDTDDLAACGEDCLSCEPGHRVACTAEMQDDVPCGCYEECTSPGVGEWCMQPGKREAPHP